MKFKNVIVIVLKVILVLWLCIFALFLCDFLDIFFIHSPASLFNVKHTLNKSFTIGFVHTSSEQDKSKKYRKSIYHFEDENGVAFTVSSGYISGSPFPTRNTTWSYAYELLKAAKLPLEEALNSTPGLKWRKSDDTDNYEILIDNEQDLAITVSGVSKAIQAVSPFPIKRNNYQYEGIGFGTPYIYSTCRC